jgi:hypothetical protein
VTDLTLCELVRQRGERVDIDWMGMTLKSP